MSELGQDEIETWFWKQEWCKKICGRPVFMPFSYGRYRMTKSSMHCAPQLGYHNTSKHPHHHSLHATCTICPYTELRVFTFYIWPCGCEIEKKKQSLKVGPHIQEFLSSCRESVILIHISKGFLLVYWHVPVHNYTHLHGRFEESRSPLSTGNLSVLGSYDNATQVQQKENFERIQMNLDQSNE